MSEKDPATNRPYENPVLGVIISIGYLIEHTFLVIVYHIGVVVDNAAKLISMLVKGTKTWVIMALRLLLFAVLLAPGWYRLLRYWFFDPFILKNVEFGKGAKLRNVMDIYLPHIHTTPYPKKSAQAKVASNENLAPVVIFVSGGAWIIGYKLWSCLVARGLATLGMLVIVPDYRNFPQGDICDMMEDIREATLWTHAHAHRFGGDRNKIVLAGQSAGAHICLSLLVNDYLASKNLHKSNLDEFLDRYPAQKNGFCSEDLSTSSQPPPSETRPVESDLTNTETKHGNAGIQIKPDSKQLVKIEDMTVETSLSEEDNGTGTDEEEEDTEFSSFHVMPMSQILNNNNHSSLDALLSNTSSTPLPHTKDTNDNGANSMLWFSPVQATEMDTSGILPLDISLDTIANHEELTNEYRQHTATVDSETNAEIVMESETLVLNKVRLYVGISGPLDLVALSHHLHQRGLDASILSWICRGNVHRFSPALLLTQYVQHMAQEKDKESVLSSGLSPAGGISDSGSVVHSDCLSDFVPVALFHGSQDRSIPCTVSRRFASLMLQHAGEHRILYREYDGWTHTDAILEAPLAGSADFFCDVAAAVHFFTSHNTTLNNNDKASTKTPEQEKDKEETVFPLQRIETDDFAHTHHHHNHRFNQVTSVFQQSSPLHHLCRNNHQNNHHTTNNNVLEEILPPLAPTWLVQCARYINPF